MERFLLEVEIARLGGAACVRLRTVTNDDGTIERGQQPELPPWEAPKRNPHERRRAPGCEPAAEIGGLSALSEDAAGDAVAA